MNTQSGFRVFQETRAALENGRFAVSSSLIPGFVLAIDGLAILLAGLVTWAILPEIGADRVDAYIFCVAFLTIVVPLLMGHSGLYDIDAVMRPIGRSDRIAVALGTAFLLFLAIAFSLKVSEEFSRLWIVSFGLGATVLVIAARVGVCRAIDALSRRGFVGRSIAVLGTGEQAMQFLRRAGLGRFHLTRIIGLYAPAHAHDDFLGENAVLGGAEELIAAARAGAIDDVVVAMPWQQDSELQAIVNELQELPVNIYIATDLVGYRLQLRPALAEFQGLPLYQVVKRPISGWGSVAKRVEDLVLGTLLFVLILPFLAIVAIAIKLDSPGPVLFRQQRLGFNNRTFSIYKFRSMYHRERPHDPSAGFEAQATRDDERVTRIGRIIRSTSVDELPQLLNVLQGTMSLVGPRPHALSHNAEYGGQIRGYFARHKVKPGITGWAQVNGLRGETALVSMMRERVRYDLFYCDNWSVMFDLRILLRTAFVVLFQRNAY